MSIFDFLFGNKPSDNNISDTADVIDATPRHRNAGNYAFVDAEVGMKDNKVHDIGSLRHDGALFHNANKAELAAFLQDVDYVCGHNIVHHDAKYLFDQPPFSAAQKSQWLLVDTLYMSPLLFAERPYHNLVKDDKLVSDDVNNPVNDCKKARSLLFDEIARWNSLSRDEQSIFSTLLYREKEFEGFLSMVNALGLRLLRTNRPDNREDIDYPMLEQKIKKQYAGRICGHADIVDIAMKHPCELAYALALVDANDHHSVTPGWVLYNYPEVEHIMLLLRHRRCSEGCDYCNTFLDIHQNLKQHFGYSSFRTYDGQPLQERAAQAAADGKSLLAIFPTGGGKSLTFQLPALMDGHSVHGLTVRSEERR